MGDQNSHRPGKKRREEWLAEESDLSHIKEEALGNSHTDLARRDMKSGLQRRRLVTHQGGSTWETVTQTWQAKEVEEPCQFVPTTIHGLGLKSSLVVVVSTAWLKVVPGAELGGY